MTIKFDTTHETELLAKSVYELARLADCATPDALDSEGAEMLDNVRREVIEAFQYDSWGSYPTDTVHQIADSCVPIYSHRRAVAFADLSAWQEMIDGQIAPYENIDLVQFMGVALYQICERLAFSLFEEYKHTLEEIEEA